MTQSVANSISVHSCFDLAATPDCTLIKLHFAGEGMTLEDAVATVERKVTEATQMLKENYPRSRALKRSIFILGKKRIAFDLKRSPFRAPLLCKACSFAWLLWT